MRRADQLKQSIDQDDPRRPLVDDIEETAERNHSLVSAIIKRLFGREQD